MHLFHSHNDNYQEFGQFMHPNNFSNIPLIKKIIGMFYRKVTIEEINCLKDIYWSNAQN